jgi:DNA-binding winged helix-turn-helix (wHTH) protein
LFLNLSCFDGWLILTYHSVENQLTDIKMKTIIVTKTDKGVEFWKDVLLESGLTHEIVLYDDLFLKLGAYSSDKQFYAVILDGVKVDLFYLERVLRRVDFFIIVNDWRETLEYQVEKDHFSLRFYKMPIITSVIMDDVKSVTKVKDYIEIGEIKLGELSIDINARTVGDGIKSVFLRNKEFDLFLFLVKNRGRVVSRAALLDQVWDMNAKIVTNTVDVHISKLRKILKFEFGISSLIKTIPCCGYVLSEVYGE